MLPKGLNVVVGGTMLLPVGIGLASEQLDSSKINVPC